MQWFGHCVARTAHVAPHTRTRTIRKSAMTANECPSLWWCHRSHQWPAYCHRIYSNRMSKSESCNFWCDEKCDPCQRRMRAYEPLRIDATADWLSVDDREHPTIWENRLHRHWQIHWSFRVRIWHWTQNRCDHCMCASMSCTTDPTIWWNDPNWCWEKCDYSVMGSSRRCTLLWCAHDKLIWAWRFRRFEAQCPKFVNCHRQRHQRPYFDHALTMPTDLNEKSFLFGGRMSDRLACDFVYVQHQIGRLSIDDVLVQRSIHLQSARVWTVSHRQRIRNTDSSLKSIENTQMNTSAKMLTSLVYSHSPTISRFASNGENRTL